MKSIITETHFNRVLFRIAQMLRFVLRKSCAVVILKNTHPVIPCILFADWSDLNRRPRARVGLRKYIAVGFARYTN